MTDEKVAAPGPRLDAAGFAEKWLGNTRTERAASQEHFIDLCRMLDEPTPNEADSDGEWYAFEKGVQQVGGGGGFADIWKHGHFAWEYKGKHKNLDAAYQQLLRYREPLKNPPLLVVCDLDRFEVHTNFTNTAKVVHVFSLTDLRDAPAEPLRLLRAVMTVPEDLRPDVSPAEVTEEAASQFARLASRLQARGHEPEGVAHFLNRVLFCLFAEDVRLLPASVLTRLIRNTLRQPADFAAGLRNLFGLMADGGGLYGTERIEWFNGSLFDSEDVIELDAEELAIVMEASNLDWSQVEPTILGTLFERGLDPDKRGQLGAHYTDREKILMVVEPAVMTPLRREFDAMKTKVESLHASRMPNPYTRDGRPRTRRPRWEREAEAAFQQFLQRLREVRVLDPACGSGNFLYVTLRLLKDLEKEVAAWGAEHLRITNPLPAVGPHNVLGIETNPYAAELTRVSIWVGHIQWMIENGFGYSRQPILQSLDNIEHRDAILEWVDPQTPGTPRWPEAEFIVGNPPFLGGKLLRRVLGDDYVEALFEAWGGLVPKEADLVCYWHETARELIAAGGVRRASLLATNSVRGGANRKVLERIKDSGDIFMGWSDEPWVVEGVAVRVSIVGQDDGSEAERFLDGGSVSAINPDLTTGVDLTQARRLDENTGLSFMGDTKGGSFDISGAGAREMLAAVGNVNGRPNSDVVVPWINGEDITGRPRDMFIIDFGVDMPEIDAAQYEAPFEYVRMHVLPERTENQRPAYRERWWLHVRPRPALRDAVSDAPRYVVTPTVAKHRVFVWQQSQILPDHQIIVIARDDDYTFGVLHSRVHELWALRKGTSLEDRPRYTPTTTFETFPFPWPLNTPGDALAPQEAAHLDAIATIARDLNETRERWLNPPELVRTQPDILPHLPPRPIPKNEVAAKQLAKRTLTNLYNARPAWLDLLHGDLDRAVLAAYGWPEDISDDDLLKRLFALNSQRASAGSGQAAR